MKLKSLAFIFVLCAFHCFSQAELYGQWKAVCPMELKGDGKSMFVCGLCTFVQNETMGTFGVKEMYMDVSNDGVIRLSDDEKTYEIFYEWNAETKQLEFFHNQTRFKFKLLPGKDKDNYILKEENGSIVNIERI